MSFCEHPALGKMTVTTGLNTVKADTLRLRRADGSVDDFDEKLTTMDAAINSAGTIATDTAGTGEVELISGNQLRLLGPGMTTSVNLFGNKLPDDDGNSSFIECLRNCECRRICDQRENWNSDAPGSKRWDSSDSFCYGRHFGGVYGYVSARSWI